MTTRMRYVEKLMTMTRVAREFAALGTDPRLKVGAVVAPVDMSCVYGVGYNGAASGLPHESVLPSASQIGAGTSGAAHAEANALIKAGRLPTPSILFTTLMPCPFCAPLVVNSKMIVAVVYDAVLLNQLTGESILTNAGLDVVQSSDLEKADARAVSLADRWSMFDDARSLRKRLRG